MSVLWACPLLAWTQGSSPDSQHLVLGRATPCRGEAGGSRGRPDPVHSSCPLYLSMDANGSAAFNARHTVP